MPVCGLRIIDDMQQRVLLPSGTAMQLASRYIDVSSSRQRKDSSRQRCLVRLINHGGLTLSCARHAAQLNAELGSSCTIGGKKYDLLQFHFHHPSEHLLAGKHLDLECHLVHRASDGELVVVGVFIRPGEHNAVPEKVFAATPRTADTDVRSLLALNATIEVAHAGEAGSPRKSRPACLPGATPSL
jgi:carbonic anhydrase